MEEELYKKILNATDEEKHKLVIDNINDISNDQILNIIKNMQFISATKLWRALIDNYNFDVDFLKPVAIEIMNRDGVQLLVNNSEELHELGYFDTVVQIVMTSLTSVIEAIKLGVSKYIFLNNIIDFNNYDFSTLTDFDKNFLLDNFDVYIPNNILHKLGIDINTINKKRLDEIKELDDVGRIVNAITCFSDAESIIEAISICGDKINTWMIVTIIAESNLTSEERVKLLNEYSNRFGYKHLNRIAYDLTHEEKILFQRNQIRSMMEDAKIYVGRYELENLFRMLLATELGEMKIPLETVKIEFTVDAENHSNNGTYISTFQWNEDTLEYTRTSEYIFNLYNRIEDLENGNEFTRVDAIKQACSTVFHEVQHHRQALMIDKKVSSKKSIQYARDKAVVRYLEASFRNKNYSKLAGESDAFFVEIAQLAETIGENDFEQQHEQIEYKKRIETGKYEFESDTLYGTNKHWSSNESEIERDDATIKILDSVPVDIMKILLRLYPVLQKQYSLSDGKRKSPADLVTSMNEEVLTISRTEELSDDEKKRSIKNAQEMYYELVYKALEIASPKQILELRVQMGEEDCRSFFDKMKVYFDAELERKLQIIEEYAQIDDEKKRYYYKNSRGIVMTENGNAISVNEFIDSIPCESLPKVSFFSQESQSWLDEKDIIKKYMASYINLEGKISAQANIFDEVGKEGGDMSVEEFCEMHLQTVVSIAAKKTERDEMEKYIQWAMMPLAWIQAHKESSILIQYYQRRQENISKVCRIIFENDRDENKSEEYSPILSEAVKLTESECAMNEIYADANKVVLMEVDKGKIKQPQEISR